MLSIQPCSSVNFGRGQMDPMQAIGKGLSVAQESAFLKGNGRFAHVMENDILVKNGMQGRIPSTKGGVRVSGIPELSDFYKKIDKLFN